MPERKIDTDAHRKASREGMQRLRDRRKEQWLTSSGRPPRKRRAAVEFPPIGRRAVRVPLEAGEWLRTWGPTAYVHAVVDGVPLCGKAFKRLIRPRRESWACPDCAAAALALRKQADAEAMPGPMPIGCKFCRYGRRAEAAENGWTCEAGLVSHCKPLTLRAYFVPAVP